MKLRFFYPTHIGAFAYAVLYKQRVVYSNPLFQLCFTAPTQSHLTMPTKTVRSYETPVPHYALCNRFWLEEKEFTLLSCLPKDAELLQTEEPEGVMQTVADLFRAVLAFTDQRNTGHTVMRADLLFQDVCRIINEKITSSLGRLADSANVKGATTALDRDGLMLVIGLLVPILAGHGQLMAGLEKEQSDVTLVLTAAGGITNVFYRSLARAIGAACGFSITFTENGVRLLLPAATAEGLVLSSNITADAVAVQIGMLLSEGAEQSIADPHPHAALRRIREAPRCF